MNKLLSFATGLLCGAAVGSTLALLLTPASGNHLREQIQQRIDQALTEAKRARLETEVRLRETYLKEVNREQ